MAIFGTGNNHTVELAEKFLPYVDEVFTAESKKDLVTNQDFTWDGAQAVNVYTVTTAGMNDYDRAGTGTEHLSAYGAIEGLNATVQRMALTRDRSFTFAIDKMDQDETVNNLNAASALARQQREVVIPEVDSYVFKIMTENAGIKPEAIALTADTIYDEVLKANTELDNALVPDTGRYLIVTPEGYQMLKQDQSFIMATEQAQDMLIKGIVGVVDGVQVIKVPSARLPEGFGFMLCHPSATVAPVKLAEYKTHTDPPFISGSLVEGRIVYDAFVMKNKAKGIYYQALTPTAG